MNSRDPDPDPRDGAARLAESASWVFDLDGCLIDSLSGSTLRPQARGVLERLGSRGGRVLLWSAGGDDYARARARQFGVEGLFSGFFGKDQRDGEGYYRTEHLLLGGGHAIFVDDHPEDLSPRLDVVAVPPYLSDDPHDRGLQEVARRVGRC